MIFFKTKQSLSIYLSDDGCSNLTFYAMLEDSHFSKIWLPFCKKFRVEPRSLKAYFCSNVAPLGEPVVAKEWSIKVLLVLKIHILSRDGNLTRPSLLRLAQVFSALQMWWVGMGQDFSPALRGEAKMNLDFLDPPLPIPASPRPVLLKIIIVNFLYPKTLLFKQIYQYQFILFYLMWFSAFILLCV